MSTELLFVLACGVLALVYGFWASRSVLAASAGTTRMQEIAGAIREANAHDGPVVIDFVIEKVDDLYPMIPAGQSVQELIEDPN